MVAVGGRSSAAEDAAIVVQKVIVDLSGPTLGAFLSRVYVRGVAPAGIARDSLSPEDSSGRGIEHRHAVGLRGLQHAKDLKTASGGIQDPNMDEVAMTLDQLLVPQDLAGSPDCPLPPLSQAHNLDKAPPW